MGRVVEFLIVLVVSSAVLSWALWWAMKPDESLEPKDGE